MLRTSFVVPALLALLLVSCKKESNPEAAGRPEFAYNVKAAQFLDMVNNVRKSGCKCGDQDMPPVPPVQWDDLLAKAAYNHSEDMNKRNYFEHESPEGVKLGTRLKELGYDYSWAGENIARGQTTEQEAFNSWIKSPGHCRNIMSSTYKEMGLGRSGNYWTQTFAASR